MSPEKDHRRNKSIGARSSMNFSTFAKKSILYVLSFMLGCVLCSTILLNKYGISHHDRSSALFNYDELLLSSFSTSRSSEAETIPGTTMTSNSETKSSGPLNGMKILVAIASFDFSQFPHLEEQLDAFHDLCVTGAIVHVYIHTTVPYTVALIDLLNTRINCSGIQVKIVLKSPALRLNLVDCHRTLFYEKIDEYDLFIYTEDDHQITPTIVATYAEETKRIEKIVNKSPAEDFNIGIVRYEYNYPPEVIIDDKSRHATENVTRVYWEHPFKPLVPKSMSAVEGSDLPKEYVTMANHHQGMFLATRQLLKAWKDRPGCNFDVVRQRPGLKSNPSQPTQGTQRVWMSSNMLYGRTHCNVKQVIPMNRFGQLTVLHLPNKNYRRVGKKGRLGGAGSVIENEFGTGKETFAGPDLSLPTAMQFHLEMRKAYPVERQNSVPYNGIMMVNEMDDRMIRDKAEHMELVGKRMKAFDEYVARGGILSEMDMESWNWVKERTEA